MSNKSKNTFTDDIYGNLYLIEEFLNSDEEFEYFSKVIEKIIDKDPDIYDALIWKAKIMKHKNLDKKKIFQLEL